MSDQTTKLAWFGATTLFPDRLVQRDGHTLRSALLSQVDFCAVERVHYPILVIIGAALIVLSLFATDFFGTRAGWGEFLKYSALLAGIVFVLIYNLSRQIILTIHAGQGTIRETVRGKRLDLAVAFIQAVEAAKRAYDRHGPALEPGEARETIQQ